MHAGADLTVEVIGSIGGLERLARDYRHLQHVTLNTLPFALHEWHLAWCRHFLGSSAVIQDEPMFHVVRDSDGSCVAVIPFIRTTRRLAGLHVTSVGLLGADPAITEIRTALVHPGYEARVAGALSRCLRNSREWDWIQWSGACDAFAAAIGEARALEWQPVAPSYVLDLPASWELLRAGLKRNIRESLRHCYNSLKRDGHAFELQVAVAPAQVRDALDRLFELHAMRAAMPGTIDHPNRFTGSLIRDFMHEVCGALAAKEGVRVFQIAIAGRIVASRIGFVVGDSLYLYYSGFDPAWARYSVMTTAVAEAIKYAIVNGLKTVNLSPGNDVSKTRWSPREVPHQTAYEHSRRVRSRLVSHAYLKARSGEGLQGWLLQHLIPGRTWG